MRFLTNPSTDPWYNMSFDEYCLEQYPSNDPFFYLWRNRPSVIIGLNQNDYSEVNLAYLEEQGIRLARRVTGGGAVYHDLQNLNYTIVGREATPRPVVEALRALGVPAIVEGVEDEEQYRRMKQVGCDIIQGYYFSRPVDAASFEPMLKDI